MSEYTMDLPTAVKHEDYTSEEFHRATYHLIMLLNKRYSGYMLALALRERYALYCPTCIRGH